MDKKKFLIALIVLLLVIIICYIIKFTRNNSSIEIANSNILTDNDASNIFNTLTNVEQRTANEITDNITNNIEDGENKESKDNKNNIETKDKETDKSNDTTTSKNSSNSSNKTNNQSSNNKVNTTTSNKDNSSTNTKEDNKNEEKQENNTDKETEDTEKEETNTGNEKLANTFFSEYNKQKTQEAVNYINQQMKKDEMYEKLGGYAVAVTTKPTNNWMSYSSNSKLDGMALAGCIVKVYVENYYRYNSKGTDYYLYDTKIYVYQEVI